MSWQTSDCEKKIVYCLSWARRIFMSFQHFSILGLGGRLREPADDLSQADGLPRRHDARDAARPVHFAPLTETHRPGNRTRLHGVVLQIARLRAALSLERAPLLLYWGAAQHSSRYVTLLLCSTLPSPRSKCIVIRLILSETACVQSFTFCRGLLESCWPVTITSLKRLGLFRSGSNAHAHYNACMWEVILIRDFFHLDFKSVRIYITRKIAGNDAGFKFA